MAASSGSGGISSNTTFQFTAPANSMVTWDPDYVAAGHLTGEAEPIAKLGQRQAIATGLFDAQL